jgi:UDP-N-acetyl-D-mannosaminuronic acid dehydrogenase
MEDGLQELLLINLKRGNLRIQNLIPKKIDSKFVVVVIGTPVDEHGNPDAVYLEKAFVPYLAAMNSGQIIILRSTVFPGVTNLIQNLVRESGKKIQVVYCPERIAEGVALKELKSLPQIIGTKSFEDFELTSNLFKKLGCETVQMSAEEAELAKLFTNSWRYIKFAIANEFWTIASKLGLSYEKIRLGLTYNYPRASDLPKAGFAAGPCLLKDTLQLNSSFLGKFSLGNAAISVNEGLPFQVVDFLERTYDLENLVVGLLGVAFKPEIDDSRSSLTFKLRKLLKVSAKEVLITDPFIKNDSRILSLDEVVSKSDLLIICTNHSIYKNINTKKPIHNPFVSF